MVRAGDSLSTIAAKEGVGPTLIERLNPNLDPLSIQPENCVDLIPHGCRKLAARGNAGTAVTASSNNPQDPYYVVRAGDSLSTIAAKEGVTLALILRRNSKTHPSSIQPGDCVNLIPHGCTELAARGSANTFARRRTITSQTFPSEGGR